MSTREAASLPRSFALVGRHEESIGERLRRLVDDSRAFWSRGGRWGRAERRGVEDAVRRVAEEERRRRARVVAAAFAHRMAPEASRAWAERELLEVNRAERRALRRVWS